MLTEASAVLPASLPKWPHERRVILTRLTWVTATQSGDLHPDIAHLNSFSNRFLFLHSVLPTSFIFNFDCTTTSDFFLSPPLWSITAVRTGPRPAVADTLM